MGLDKLLYLQGVGAEFINCHGQDVTIPAEDRQGVLACMLDALGEIESTSEAKVDIERRVLQLDAKPWTQLLPGFQHTGVDKPHLHLYLPRCYQSSIWIRLLTETGQEIHAELLPETFEVIGDYHFEETTYLNYRVSLNALSSEFAIELGYHQIEVSLCDGSVTETGIILVAPAQAFQFASNGQLQSSNETNKQDARYFNPGENKRPWGISIQLYSLRSEEQWGIGDFGDLSTLIEVIALQGGDFIQLNPLHALNHLNAESISPYSPDDRRRLNPLYIDIASVDEYQHLETQRLAGVVNDRKKVLNRGNWLNYEQTIELKYHIFHQLYDEFCTHELMINSPRAQEFFHFVDSQGIDLDYFSAELASQSPKGTPRDSNFYCYLQFVAETQLEACQAKARALGMSIGLIRDLAVGASPDGVEVRQNRHVFCLNASIGAPADPFAPQGQNWGLTPLDPIKLKQDNYRHFITIVRRNMNACGALRIDHVMALLRLWWCPNNPDLGSGAYVYYPIETLLAIICLESQRAQCCVIGEDLGIVPPELSGYLTKAGIYSNQLFYFSKHPDRFLQPDEHKTHSLMMLANHDVPTLAAWWSASDLHLQRQLELLNSDEILGVALNQRERDKLQLISLFNQHDLLPANSSLSESNELNFEQVLHAWLRLIAKSHSVLLSVQLCDLVSERHSVNIPGTWKEYANWQRRLPYTLDEIALSPKVKLLLREIASERFVT
ncbi:4-alpha-glucanotransferase [Shewanella eurypsychrophilus]|uniref:4-alpha-glucanotransferase n=1 Tax=Shewanella eurypsychrophilus TaxID=2593656 RepID=A0ABX6V3K4_9GAMM|nr:MULTISPECIES: 4-alpha-glucanotransferase [Shewanella]QFU21846.1 4-alpha-glucanotransferase [Shewanella sp. YLB-09]QPG57135.1 4-alpha-glucanotransferase [Shewanella eurypsychrophilus]